MVGVSRAERMIGDLDSCQECCCSKEKVVEKRKKKYKKLTTRAAMFCEITVAAQRSLRVAPPEGMEVSVTAFSIRISNMPPNVLETFGIVSAGLMSLRESGSSRRTRRHEES